MKCPKCGTEGVEGGICFYCKGIEDMKREKEEKKQKKKLEERKKKEEEEKRP